MVKITPISIREAKDEDVYELSLFCRKLYRKAGYDIAGSFDVKKVATFMEVNLANPAFLTRVVEKDGNIVGFAAYQITENPFSQTLIGSEIFFFLDPEASDGKTFLLLLKEYEEWCKKNGCVSCKFGVIPLENSDRIEKILSKKKFKRAEIAYIKEI